MATDSDNPIDFQSIVDQIFPGSQLLAMDRLTGGVSADVYRLDIEQDNKTTSVVLRIHGETHGGHKADLEFTLLNALHSKGLPVPSALFHQSESGLLGYPFLVISFLSGSSANDQDPTETIDAMAAMLAKIHATPVVDLPQLPERLDPLPEVLEFLPEGEEWQDIHDALKTLNDTAYKGEPKLLHGDFWVENVLWLDGKINAVLDWEDAAIGDPLSDVASASVELRYVYGIKGMQRFIESYKRHATVDSERLALWHIYVAAAAQKYMGLWGLEEIREANMRAAALATIRETGDVLISKS